MHSQTLRNFVTKLFPKPLRTFLLISAFFVALDACIALNRWWLEGGFQTYFYNLVVMSIGFTIFIILASRTKIELAGYIFLVIAIYFICDFEIGGMSKHYLTPFDPIFNTGPVFVNGSTWFGLSSIVYRKGMAISASVIAGLILAISKLTRPREND